MRYLTILLIYVMPMAIYSQDSLDFEIDYQINQIHPPLSVSTEKLKEANSINDINHFFKPSWVKEFISIEVAISQKGKIVQEFSENDILTENQKALMATADFGSDIAVNIHYIPNNDLMNNEAKLFDFTFKVHPKNEANFPGGETKLNEYLKYNIVDKIETSPFNQYQLSAVKFIINEEGEVKEVEIIESSKDPETDELLKTAIMKMPCWTPATYTDGTKAAQEFVLTAGDHRSCVINLLNIRELD